MLKNNQHITQGPKWHLYVTGVIKTIIFNPKLLNLLS